MPASDDESKTERQLLGEIEELRRQLAERNAAAGEDEASSPPVFAPPITRRSALDRPTLVPGRECGGCTICCVVFTIDQPEIQKPPGAACRHCTGVGCAIYETRPPVCRAFHCAWRTEEMFGDDWRPDKSGVLPYLETDGIPDSFDLSTGIGLLLVANPLTTVRQRWFQEFVATGVMNSIPLMLALPGPRGYGGVTILLNTEEMLEAIARRTVQTALEMVLKTLQAWDFAPTVITHTGHDVSNRPEVSHRNESLFRAHPAWVDPVILSLLWE